MEYKGINYHGSEALFYSLLRAIDEKKFIIDVDNLSEISEEEFSNIFYYNGIKPSLMHERYLLFNNTINGIKLKGNEFFDELFGWDKEKIVYRSKVIASSEATVGNIIRYHMPNSIMVYTPTMLERAQVYSGNRQDDPLPIVFPKK